MIASRFALVNILSIALVALVIKSFRRWNNGQFKHADTTKPYGWTIAGILSLIVLAYSIWFRPPIPLKLRKSIFSPAAGLKTTAQDYARFITELMNPNHLDPELVDEMLTPQVRVNDHNDWGLGLGIQKGKEKVIWHWGVNYPGFQSLFVVWPERKDGIVIVMNGGPISLTAGNPRFSGLELAREIIIKTFGGQHYDYWQQVN